MTLLHLAGVQVPGAGGMRRSRPTDVPWTCSNRSVREFPDVPNYRGGLADCQYVLFADLLEAGRHEEAARVHVRAVDLAEKLVHDHPALPGYRGTLSRLLLRLADFHSVPPEVRFLDPALGLKLARRAVALSPEDRRARQSLGWAQYRAGDWKGCIDLLDKTDGKYGDFFQAMAFWQTGEKARARTSFVSADLNLAINEKRVHPNHPRLGMLRRLRTEAAALLGVKDEPTVRGGGAGGAPRGG